MQKCIGQVCLGREEKREGEVEKEKERERVEEEGKGLERELNIRELH